MNAITDNRRNTWQELIDSTNMTHSSRIAWKTIEMLGNDYTITHLRYEVTAGCSPTLREQSRTPMALSQQRLPKPAEDDQADSNVTRSRRSHLTSK